MTSTTRVIVEVATGGLVDRQLRADPPPIVADERVVLDRIPPDESGGLGLPEAGEVVLSVLSPEGLRRESQEVHDVVSQAKRTDEPLVIMVEAAEELRENELRVVLDAAERADRLVILRVAADA
jgi:hypothetical protein